MLARCLFLFALFASTLLPGRAAAHPQARSYCSVQTVPGGLEVKVETAAHLLAPVLGLPAKRPDDATLRDAAPRLIQALTDRVQARTPNGACRVTSEAPELVDSAGERAVSVQLHFHCPEGPVTLRNSWRLDVDPQSETVCAIDGAAWVFQRGALEKAVGEPPTLESVVGAFVVSGAHHVFGGIDHVLFVVALLLAAALATRGRRLTSSLGSVAAVVTGFTLGHSVTLIAAGLGWVSLAPRVTESVIALSIVFVGLENVIKRRIRWRGLTAALFGLVHGFGFAAVLAETELPRRGAVWALVAFNVGIELAQLVIVVAVFPALALAARKPWYRTVLLVPLSLSIATLAALWFVKRAAGVDFLPWLGS